ncbi:hypothetical protein AB4874_19900, partial [Thioclava sp. 15-R06ZXC-3]
QAARSPSEVRPKVPWKSSSSLLLSGSMDQSAVTQKIGHSLTKLQNKIVRFATKDNFSEAPCVLNKFALLKWRKGTSFSRAPHSIDRAVRVSEDICAALLHKSGRDSCRESSVVADGHEQTDSTDLQDNELDCL